MRIAALEDYVGKEVKLTGEFDFRKGSEISCRPNHDCPDTLKALVFNIDAITFISDNLRTPSQGQSMPVEALDSQITLLSPETGAYISRGEATQLFSWNFEGELAENHFFEVRFYQSDLVGFQAPFGWVREYRQQINLNNLESHGNYEWNVVIVQGNDGKWERDIYESPRSSFDWEG